MKISLIQITNKRNVPLSSLYLIANLEKYNHSVDLKLIDTQYIKQKQNKPLKSDLIEKAFKNTNKIVAIGCQNNMLPYMLYSIIKFKKKHPDKIIILGGYGPLEFAEEIIEKFNEINFVVKDRDPSILAKLVTNLEDNHSNIKVKGVVFKKNNKIRYTHSKKDYIDNYFFPKRHKINLKNQNLFTLLSIEGCPYKCAFCSPFMQSKKLKFRPLDQIIEEIKWALKNSNKKIKFGFIDEAFVYNKKRVYDLCNKLKENNLKIKWSCYGRINHMDEELMKKMKDSGCDSIFYGIESGSDKILKQIRKGFNSKLANDILIKSKKYFKEVTASFIWGYPFESLNDLKKTLLMIQFLNLNKIKILPHLLTVMKNTEIYLKYKQKTKFSESLSTSMNYPLKPEPKEFKNFVKNNKEIFLGYNYYDHDSFKKKIKIMNRPI